ncbi:hypothetical protein BHE90_014507 [Fusarium euwallaceae]|uniref:Uncharacterized protein n=3 Tax=Fusarium solani species complex TaxID=232080 RepID=A0A3M2RI85_9HYPO|nr:hypothetical protein CDV36_014351 [Fusarium kuroshium]RSL52922.1 hypothetical protein CEP51_014974 [Fusarium floridanum]RTE71092.1 hypothetical protein BHE90_014507 [Fusarium euwallaceae]
MLAKLSPEESSELPPSYHEVVSKIKEKRKFDTGRSATELWTETLFDGSKKTPVAEQNDFEILTRDDFGQLPGAEHNNKAGAIPPLSPSLPKDKPDEFNDDTIAISDTEDIFMLNMSTSASLEAEEHWFVQLSGVGTVRQELDAKLKRLKRKKAKIEEEIKTIEKKGAKCV